MRRISFILALALMSSIVAALAAPSASANTPVTGAGFTTVNEDVDGPDHCANGNPNINCNIYDGKEFVWLNGGPNVAYVGDGDYFFAVLEPGGQSDPNDGATHNLSDDFDTRLDRSFSVTGGVVSYAGPHEFANNKIRLVDYADTSNPGGVYIMAICSLADGYPVDPSDCKYDAFKVNAGGGGGQGASDLAIVKDADGSFTNTYTWTISKDVDKTIVKQIGGNATFTYTVTMTRDAGSISDVKVEGTITVFNFNVDDQSNTAQVSGVDVTDELSDGTVCAVTDGSSQTISTLAADFDYSCDLVSLPQGQLRNTATVDWPDQDLSNGAHLDGGSASFTFPTDPEGTIDFAETTVDDCVTVTDTFNGVTTTLGTPCDSTSYEYSHTVPVPRSDCVTYDNTATFVTNTTGVTDSGSQTVTVCGPAKTGALTMGFWQNKNGQNIIKTGSSTAGVCNSGTWLRQFAPFQDLSATASCSQVATYVTNVIKAAKCTSTTRTCNSMLKAQTLATALDVYFSDSALGGNRIGATGPLGGVSIDLTQICRMFDNSNGGTCTGSFETVSSAFGGASSLTVLQMLAYAASQSNAGGGTWYGNVKATQVLAKDAFDAINNQVAFSA